MTESGIPLTNKLSKEVQQIFQPLYLMQMLVLNPRYQLRHNFIHPNMWLNKFILLTSLGLYVSFSLYRIFDIYLYFDLTMFLLGNYLQFASYFNLVFYCVGFIINFTNLFIHSKRYVAFVLIFQRIHTCIGNKASFRSAINISRIYVSIFFGAYFLMSCFVITIFKQTSWVIVFNTAIMITIDANMIYAITLIHLLTNEVKLWNAHISMFSKSSSDEDQHKIMFETYLHIAKSHRICRTVFQYMILYQTLETFFSSLVNCQMLIEFRKFYPGRIEFTSIFMVIYVWTAKAVVIQIALGLSFDRFYQAIGGVQDTCVLITTSNCPTDGQTKLCKNILRFHRASFSRMSVCGLFSMDINHQLRLVALLTNYIVVLLQIAFL